MRNKLTFWLKLSVAGQSMFLQVWVSARCWPICEKLAIFWEKSRECYILFEWWGFQFVYQNIQQPNFTFTCLQFLLCCYFLFIYFVIYLTTPSYIVCYLHILCVIYYMPHCILLYWLRILLFWVCIIVCLLYWVRIIVCLRLFTFYCIMYLLFCVCISLYCVVLLYSVALLFLSVLR
jgi:hypothetical protein